MAKRKVVRDTGKVGKFTREETERLLTAVDQFIAENYECPRDVALRAMISRRGNSPSIVSLIAREVLPERNVRSVYSYVRRHFIDHKNGMWTPQELLTLLKNYFESTEDSSFKWKRVAEALNRSPEQIHDKLREIKPYIHAYKGLVTNPELSDKVKESELQKAFKRSSPAKKRVQEMILNDLENQQKLYDCVREFVGERVEAGSLDNVPWVKVQERFPNLTTTKLRIHFNMTLLPRVYRQVYPGFSPRMVARTSIRWLRKLLKRPNFHLIQSLNDVDFRSKFPQLPLIYVRYCTKRALVKVLRKYRNQVLNPQKLLLDPDISLLAMEDLEDLLRDAFHLLFRNSNFFKVIKFAYKEMEVKKWKVQDKGILRQIRKDVLPECTLAP